MAVGSYTTGAPGRRPALNGTAGRGVCRISMPMRAALALATAILAPALAPAVAAADPTLPCERAADDVIDVDGMIDDWKGVKPTRAGGADKDASFDLRCLITGTTAWIVVDVRDEHVIRGSKADDRLDLTLGAGKPLKLTLSPGVDKLAPRRTLGGKAVPGWLAVEDTLQPAGWSVELAVPLAKIPGWGPSVATLALTATLADGDIPKGTAAEHTIAWAGNLGFGGKTDLLATFLAAARLPASAVTFAAAADIDPSLPGKERVVVAGGRVPPLTERSIQAVDRDEGEAVRVEIVAHAPAVPSAQLRFA